MDKKIYMFWDSGIDNAPELVKICINSWIEKNPTWELVFIDNEKYFDYFKCKSILSSKLSNLSIQGQTNILRTYLIKNFGGVWADSTFYCQTPLDDWIFEYLDNSFFGFRNPHPDRIIANWFMASEKESAIVNKWYQAIIEYFSSREKNHIHFWHHYLFKNLYNSDTQFK